MKKSFSIICILLLLAGYFTIFLSTAQAASITSVTDVLSRVKKNTLSNHTITFTTPTGVAAGQNITITFPTDFTGEASIDFTDVDMKNDGVDVTLAGTASGATWGAAFSDSGGTKNKLTLTSDTDFVAATKTVIIEIGTHATSGTTGDKRITNATTAGSFTVPITCGSADSGSLALAIADEDQVTVTATVDPYLAFNVTDAAVALGTLSRTEIKTDTATMTAATNSTSGYSITVSGATLTHTVNGSYTITAIGGGATASVPGTEQFGLKVGATGGSGAASSPYNTVDYAYLTGDQVAASAGTSTTTTYTMTYMANISGITEPGSYTTAHTYVCTGNF